MLRFSIVSGVQNAPTHVGHPSHHCTVVPRWLRRHGPPEPSLQWIGWRTALRRSPTHWGLPRSARTTPRAFAWFCPSLSAVVANKRVLLRAHCCSTCNDKLMRVCPIQFTCQRTPLLAVFLVHTDFRIDSISHFPTVKQHPVSEVPTICWKKKYSR